MDAVAIMTMNTKRHSSKRFRKCSGRALGSEVIRDWAISTSISKDEYVGHTLLLREEEGRE